MTVAAVGAASQGREGNEWDLNPMGRPPKFVHGYIDRHAKPRFYFRRAGFKSVPLPGLPWSPEFMAAYENAMAGAEGAGWPQARSKPGTMGALALSYFAIHRRLA